MNNIDGRNMNKTISRVMVEGKLYRFRSNFKNTIKEIEKDIIHLSKPNELNDPYDCVYISKTRHLVSDLMKNMILYDMSFDLDSAYKLFEQKEISISEFSYQIASNYHKYKKDDIEQFINDRLIEDSVSSLDGIRIASFTEINNSVPMWAYYASNHEGICLEYTFSKPKKDIIESLYKVTYSDIMTKNKYNNYSCTTKGLDWSHEQEWRIIREEKESELKIPYLSAVYLGRNFDMKNYSRIIEAISNNKRGKKIKLYIASNKLKDYKIHFNKLK